MWHTVLKYAGFGFIGIGVMVGLACVQTLFAERDAECIVLSGTGNLLSPPHYMPLKMAGVAFILIGIGFLFLGNACFWRCLYEHNGSLSVPVIETKEPAK